MASPFENNGFHATGLNGNLPRSRVLGPDGLPYRADAPEANFAVGHNITFAGLLSSGFRAYWQGQYDEAMRNSRDDALAMRNDHWLMSLLQERKLATASLPFRIEVDDERDPMQKAVQEGLLRIVRRMPFFRKFCMYMLEAIWYGRYGSQLKWSWERMQVPSLKDPKKDEWRKCLAVKAHMPINGDKIGHHWDGTPYVSINAAYASTVQNADITPSTSGAYALYLRGSWRWRYVIHTHEAVDADYFDSMAADAIHGVGIRSVLYWMDWLRKEWLGNVADWCERTGLGIRLWYYQANNPTSKAEVEKAARESNDRTNIFIPRHVNSNGKAAEGIEYVDTSSTGADLLLKLQQHIEEHQERYVIGQSLSGGRGPGDGLGGEGKAKLAKDTKSQIIQFDAANLGETLTADLLRPIQWWSYREPEARKVNARFVFAVDEPEPQSMLTAVKTFVTELGGKVRMSEVQSALGFGAVQEGDEAISLESIREQQGGQPGQPGAPGAPQGAPQGAPGAAPPPGMPGMPPGAPAGPPGAPPAAGGPPAAEPAPGQPPAAPVAPPAPPPGAEDIQKQGGGGQEDPNAVAAGLEDITQKGEGAEGAVGTKAKGGRRHYQYLGKWQRAAAPVLLGELDEAESDVRRMLDDLGVDSGEAEAAIGEVRQKLRYAMTHG